jgi:hypothetical protein
VFGIVFDVMLFGLKTKRGRRLAVLGGVGAMRLARSPQARQAYERAWAIAADPRPRAAAGKAVRSAARRVKR